MLFLLLMMVGFYFNPHSRKGSDSDIDTMMENMAISIHTPARGVTHPGLAQISLAGQISIHTPARGVTNTVPLMAIKHTNFNPHSRKGSDCL